MKTKLDIAIERIMDTMTDLNPDINVVAKDAIEKNIRWEIATAIKEMSFEEMTDFLLTSTIKYNNSK